MTAETAAFPDEEALVAEFPGLDRRAHGAFFTPAPLVHALLDAAAPHLPEPARLSIVDPACGAGAFLDAARRRFPGASLFGLELHPATARWCAARVRSATVIEGDGLRDGWGELERRLPAGRFELWLGNPPYNGTSPVLRDRAAYQRLRSLLPAELSRGQSLRDDFAFFLLRAATRLRGRPGAIAFVTSATLVDAFLYAPLRRFLLDGLALREVIELGAGAFRDARVRTCVTVWTSPHERAAPRHRARAASGPFEPAQLGPGASFTPDPPEWLLRPAAADAVALDRAWRAGGEPLSQLVPVSSPGLKTRFDELLVDPDADRLLSRIAAFAATRAAQLERFAADHGIPPRHLAKLRALSASLPSDFRARSDRVRPFFRYAGARHRGAIPAEARAFCYLDRRLIPRGDHRLRGDWDPHACAVKLVFNTRELPLCAALVDAPGCVHDHRHARFAPLFVPRAIREAGVGAARPGAELGPLVPNLSPRGLRRAEALGGPRAVFEALVRFINSRDVQEVWAPAFGASRGLPVGDRVLG